MYKGIASANMVVKLGNAGWMGYFGTGGLKLSQIETAIHFIQSHLGKNKPYGMNLLYNRSQPKLEEQTVDLFLQHGINYIEAAAYIQLTPALVRFRLKGVHRNALGQIEIPHYILAKVSRPESAKIFMSPAPIEMVTHLVTTGQITQEEADLATEIPISHDICVESDSGGHTDRRIALTMLPTILRLRDEIMTRYHFTKKIRVGAAGGIGTPEAAAATFILGADFILTGSINQCTVEAGTSDAAKDLLQEMNVQDTTYAPSGDMFELGAQVQVFRKGLLFPARANKLYDLFNHHNSLDEIDEQTQEKLQSRYFRRSFQEIWEETKAYYLKEKPKEITEAEINPKHKMLLIFRWYFINTTRLTLKGDTTQQSNFQIHCGSALGAFNQWVKDTPLANWRNRHVDEIAEKIMVETAAYLNQQYLNFTEKNK